MNFFVFSIARFSKHLERFRSTLLSYTATRVTGLPQIPSYNQPEKIEIWTGELNYHEETTQDEDFLAKT